MLGGKRTERVAELIRVELGTLILMKLKDPRLGFVTITRVEVSPDLRHARVWYSVLKPQASAGQSGQQAADGGLHQLLVLHRLHVRFLHRIEHGDVAADLLDLVAVQLAWRDRVDFAMAVAIGSSLPARRSRSAASGRAPGPSRCPAPSAPRSAPAPWDASRVASPPPSPPRVASTVTSTAGSASAVAAPRPTAR